MDTLRICLLELPLIILKCPSLSVARQARRAASLSATLRILQIDGQWRPRVQHVQRHRFSHSLSWLWLRATLRWLMTFHTFSLLHSLWWPVISDRRCYLYTCFRAAVPNLCGLGTGAPVRIWCLGTCGGAEGWCRHWGASLIRPPLASCCAARFPTGHGPVLVHGLGVGDPCFSRPHYPYSNVALLSRVPFSSL